MYYYIAANGRAGIIESEKTGWTTFSDEPANNA
jgi:hypothetical protein